MSETITFWCGITGKGESIRGVEIESGPGRLDLYKEKQNINSCPHIFLWKVLISNNICSYSQFPVMYFNCSLYEKWVKFKNKIIVLHPFFTRQLLIFHWSNLLVSAYIINRTCDLYYFSCWSKWPAAEECSKWQSDEIYQ